jgi:hypothetical protein
MNANLHVVPAAAPSPLAATWPDSGDAGSLLLIVQTQTKTIADQEALINRYQSILNQAQGGPTPQPVATGTVTSSGTSIAVSAVANSIVIGAAVSGAGAPPSTLIVTQVTGSPGGVGTYTTNLATSASAAPWSFTPPASLPSWPIPQDADTLMSLVQAQTALARTQAAVIQHYQEVLNISQTPAA